MIGKKIPSVSGSKDDNKQSKSTQNNLQQTQVDEVVDIMRLNVDKFLERDQKVSELEDRSKALNYGAMGFKQQAAKLKHKQRKANTKLMIIMGVISAVLVLVILIILMTSYKR